MKVCGGLSGEIAQQLTITTGLVKFKLWNIADKSMRLPA
jgi:hypothetical protein